MAQVQPEQVEKSTSEGMRNRAHKLTQKTHANFEWALGKVKTTSQNSSASLQDMLGMKVDLEVDMWVQMKLTEWDKDRTGTFTPEEVEDAMEDLKEASAKLAGTKIQFIMMFTLIFIFTMFMGGCAWIGMAISKNTEVEGSGDMRTTNPSSKKKGQTELLSTTSSQGTASLFDMLAFASGTDQWLIDESQLVQMDKISFASSNGTFHYFDVAELVRVDAGKNGTNDKLEILTTSGTQVRVWESVGELEVKCGNCSMWEGVQVNATSGGRLLSDEEILSGDTIEDQDDDDFGHGDVRRLGKGGTRVYIGGSVHHHHRGGGGGGCNGFCSVPYGHSGGCRQYCGENQCYNWGRDTFRCSAAVRSFCGPMWLLQVLAALLIVGNTMN